MEPEKRIIGRKACPWCGFESAHVKRTEGKNSYHHCPSCGLTTPAKNGQQSKLIELGMRPEPLYGAIPEPGPECDQPITIPGVLDAIRPAPRAAAPVPTAPKKPAGLWDSLLRKAES
jgi:hypothetical protein